MHGWASQPWHSLMSGTACNKAWPHILGTQTSISMKAEGSSA